MPGIEFTVYKGSKDGKILKSTTYKVDDLAPDEVLVKITHSGVCGTDEHYRNQDIVLGHEGVGVVQKVGKHVKVFKVYVIVFFTSKPINLVVEGTEQAGGTSTIRVAAVNNV